MVNEAVEHYLFYQRLTCDFALIVSVHCPVYRFQNFIVLSLDPPPVASTLGFHGHHATACIETHPEQAIIIDHWENVHALQFCSIRTAMAKL